MGPNPNLQKQQNKFCLKISTLLLNNLQMSFSTTKLGDEFLCIPKLDVAGINLVVYKDRFLWLLGVMYPLSAIPDRLR